MRNIFLKLFLVIATSFLGANETKKPKIYDCFLFFNELELLEVRLDELYDHVDYFVIIENPLTHSGMEKELCFQENKQKFAKYLDKIIHIIGPRRDKKPESHSAPDDHWYRENEQRNDLLKGLKDAKDDDIVLISDLDEIPSGEKLDAILKPLIAKEKEAIRLELKMYKDFLNRRDGTCPFWYLSIATTYKTLKKHSPEFMRTGYKTSHVFHNAGWHFTSMGGIKRYIYKTEAGAHQDKNRPDKKIPYKILRHIRKYHKLVKIDDTYPKFITKNLKYFKARNFIDDNFPINWNLRVFEKRRKKILKQEEQIIR